jgi:hypothetical protein
MPGLTLDVAIGLVAQHLLPVLGVASREKIDRDQAFGASVTRRIVAESLPAIIKAHSTGMISRLPRPHHSLGAHEPIELGSSDVAESHRFLAQCRAVRVRGFRYLCGLVVADVRGKRGHQHQRAPH